MSNEVLNCHNINKSFKNMNGDELQILNNINFVIKSGETNSIVGSSGSGKTSLLQILAGLDTPTSGKVIVCDKDISKLTDNQLCLLRNQKLGFIYQFHHLLPEFTALENTLIPATINNTNNKATQEYAKYILNKLNLSKRLEHFPNQLSGGERQRVAIARAVINQPQIVFADEPTGNLDNHTSEQVLEVFFELQQELKTSLVIVTHDTEIAKRTQNRYCLHNGNLILT
jgi:lipoprotein-releasing system ATP-binding protein